MKHKYHYLIVILLLLGLDAATKTITEGLIGYRNTVTVIENFFWLTVLHNTGAAWSFLEGQRWFFLLISLAAVVMMVWYWIKTPDRQSILLWSLTFLIAGTLGNFMDRLLLGYVRDFLSFNTFGYLFPVFNVADISLNIGVALLLLDAVLEGRHHGSI